jgi:putative oxidoreductase
MGSLAEEE